MDGMLIYDLLLYAYPFLQAAYLVWAMIHWTNNSSNMSWAMIILFFLSVGTHSANSVTVSHELFHRTQSPSQFYMGVSLLLQSSYGHFLLSHMSHHRKVGTVHDPATARLGQSLYSFVPRSWFLGFYEAWDYESSRLQKRGLSIFSLKNRLFGLIIAQIFVWLFVLYVLGVKALIFFLVQSLVAQFLIETVNFIEHYGLERASLSDPVSILHSWNAPDRFSNQVLWKLQRHSHHHSSPTVPYQSLCSYPFSPQLPAGYPTMILAALAPPIFNFLMYDRCVEFNKLSSQEKGETEKPAIIEPTVESV